MVVGAAVVVGGATVVVGVPIAPPGGPTGVVIPVGPSDVSIISLGIVATITIGVLFSIGPTVTLAVVVTVGLPIYYRIN